MEICQQYISCNNADIYTLVHTPTPGQLSDMVIFVHGLTATKNEKDFLFRHIARSLNQKGIITVQFDLGGHGDSTGDLTEYVTSKWVEEIEIVVESIRHKGNINNIHLICTGIGNILATELGHTVSKIIFLSPSRFYGIKEFPIPQSDIFSISEHLKVTYQKSESSLWDEPVFKNKSLQDFFLRLGTIDFANIVEEVKVSLLEEIVQMDFLDRISKLKNESFIIMGETSDWFPTNINLENVHIIKIPETNHILHDTPQRQKLTTLEIQKILSN